MFTKYYITFDNSQDDTPVLVVGKENSGYFLSSPTIDITNVITGNRAVELWDELTKNEKRAEVRLASEQ